MHYTALPSQVAHDQCLSDKTVANVHTRKTKVGLSESIYRFEHFSGNPVGLVHIVNRKLCNANLYILRWYVYC